MVFYCLGVTLQRMNWAYLVTGANIGQREEQLAYAARLIQERCGAVVDRSAFYETAPWGKADQPNFVNQALVVETPLGARDLMHEILYIENLMGRDRNEKYGPRNIDIDIIFFNHQVIKEPGLVVPHPQMAHRRFVLEPLNEVIPAYIHPIFYKTVTELLKACDDPLPVKKLV